MLNVMGGTFMIFQIKNGHNTVKIMRYCVNSYIVVIICEIHSWQVWMATPLRMCSIRWSPVSPQLKLKCTCSRHVSIYLKIIFFRHSHNFYGLRLYMLLFLVILAFKLNFCATNGSCPPMTNAFFSIFFNGNVLLIWISPLFELRGDYFQIT